MSKSLFKYISPISFGNRKKNKHQESVPLQSY
jgi:hypothetical protein